MSLQVGLFMNQRMRQELRMTPQLQQSIKLLQLSRVELIEEVQRELIDNPLLEEAGEETGAGEAEGQAEGQAEEQPKELLDEHERLEERPDEAPDDRPDELDWERYINEDDPPRPEELPQRLSDDELPSFEATYITRETLAEHLTWQLQICNIDEELRALALELVGNLDDDGYLRDATLEELAALLGVSAARLEEALAEVQKLDPTGVGARDLAECLTLQARAYGLGELVERLIAGHLDDLGRHRYPVIARALGVTVAQVYEATRLVQTLTPHPGASYSSDAPRYVTPDVYVRRDGDSYIVTTNDDGLPRLRINAYYRRVMRQSKDQEARRYITDRLNAAQALIKSIEQRKQTIVRVTESIVRYQRDFFERGPEHLKPLVLRTIADELGLHESTVSRVTSNKYVQTHRGLYDLKFFFNSLIQGTGDQEDLASEAVKTKIRNIISQEDPMHPLSDQRIMELLGEEGLQIARRTVAKYREAMHILSSAQRRRHF